MTPITTLLEPFINLAARTPNKVTYDRMQTALFTPLLDALVARLSHPSVDEPESQRRKRKRLSEIYPNLIESVCKPGARSKDDLPAQTIVNPQNVAMDVLKALFEAAGHADTKDANRRKMYALWKERMEVLDGPPEERLPN
jgi:ribosomal RNA-processing protein 1